MYNCPECKIQLNKSLNPAGIIWTCPTCSGKAISVYVLKKLIPDNIINKLWERAKSCKYNVRRECPICNKSIPEVPIVNEDKTIYLDICAKCHFIWFDGQEYESLPKREKETEKELSPEAREALAKFQVKIADERYEYVYDNVWLDMGQAIVETVLFMIFRRF
ncbi:MAG: zf-TFIIB domain-containing protein [Sedimentisphaerales bacterium]|nr:zf-TFIIB domain-containing protein [Sedimentisphaerales bacterium]